MAENGSKGIGYGTSVAFVASQRDAKNLADALHGVSKVGTRSLWCYPDSGQSKGSVRKFGNISLDYVSVQWDGRFVWLDMAGPDVPKDDYALSTLLSDIHVTIIGERKMVQKYL